MILVLVYFKIILLIALFGNSSQMDHMYGNFYSNNCRRVLENFANFISNFAFCAVNYSRPIRLCEICVDEYMDVIDAYHKILKIEDETGKKCKEKLINLDRLEVINGAYNYVHNLWKAGNCDNCFVKEKNGTLTSELSNSTVVFQEMHNETHMCLLNHYIESNDTYDNTVCIDCDKVYCKMNDFYNDLKNTEDMTVCVDIVDTMNITRSFWSTELGCDKRNRSHDVYLLSMFTIVAIIPIIFYVCLRVQGRKSEHRILAQEKRLAEHLNKPSTSQD